MISRLRLARRRIGSESQHGLPRLPDDADPAAAAPEVQRLFCQFWQAWRVDQAAGPDGGTAAGSPGEE